MSALSQQFYSPPPPLPTIQWAGVDGLMYTLTIFSIHAIPDWVAELACVYIFARCRYLPGDPHEAMYIGQKGETDRFCGHEKLARAISMGATELHVILVSSKADRFRIETALRHRHHAALNEQPTPAAGLGAALLGFGGLAGGNLLLPKTPVASGLAALCAPSGRPGSRSVLSKEEIPETAYSALSAFGSLAPYNPLTESLNRTSGMDNFLREILKR
jgi:hypothetical protein